MVLAIMLDASPLNLIHWTAVALSLCPKALNLFLQLILIHLQVIDMFDCFKETLAMSPKTENRKPKTENRKI